MFELGAFMAASPMLRLAGRGDRHPVLVLPGFTASDRSTEPLRWILRSQGYWTHGWRLGTNLGPTQRVIDGLHDRIEVLRQRHGQQITIIGWSLGGIYAREFARLHPDAVRQVITLGSPFRMTLGDRSAASRLVDRLSDRFNAETLNFALAENDKPPLPVPSTAIYSRDDGVVRWHTCIDIESETHENIEVRGSHSGLGWNTAVVYAISDRLAQPTDRWRRFRPPLAMRHLYPRPASWSEDRRAS
jgi:pimeloyl-ACP methyl ester carboxylesterase